MPRTGASAGSPFLPEPPRHRPSPPASRRTTRHPHRCLSVRGFSEARLRRFVADAGHELRTPLTTNQGFAELALCCWPSWTRNPPTAASGSICRQWPRTPSARRPTRATDA
ncbi:histidine kinase dimerization/phospho-acceptor domain-containing protein [Streptomyces sp. ActVer]|uniref:histidine kinase dimerization/phospho-acceptor domain-containing protein n=1 Tax=Streptomyces sp. ActVer TaxID=3014558 RepID=UPI002F961862